MSSHTLRSYESRRRFVAPRKAEVSNGLSKQSSFAREYSSYFVCFEMMRRLNRAEGVFEKQILRMISR